MKRVSLLFALLSLAVSLQGAHAATAPSNDDRANAAKVADLPAVSSVDTSGATEQVGEDLSCGGRWSVWYAWRAPSAAPLTVSVATQFPGGFFPRSIGIHVYSKARSSLTSIGCGINSFTFTPDAGTHYLFQIEGTNEPINVYWGRGGSSPASANNIVAPPFPFQEIVGLSGSVNPSDPTPTCAVAGGSYWYAFAVDQTAVYDVHLDAVEPAYFQVYEKDSNGGLQPVLGGCGATLSPNRSADAYLALFAGDKIYVQYGHNVDPAAQDDGGAAYGFFEFAPAA